MNFYILGSYISVKRENVRVYRASRASVGRLNQIKKHAQCKNVGLVPLWQWTKVPNGLT